MSDRLLAAAKMVMARLEERDPERMRAVFKGDAPMTDLEESAQLLHEAIEAAAPASPCRESGETDAARLSSAIREALQKIDRGLGDTDPQVDDDPLSEAHAILVAAIAQPPDSAPKRINPADPYGLPLDSAPEEAERKPCSHCGGSMMVNSADPQDCGHCKDGYEPDSAPEERDELEEIASDGALSAR